jgi:hypothetical protein
MDEVEQDLPKIEPVSSSPRTSNVPKTEWRSCCLVISPSAIKYFIQVGVLTALMAFSATMLVVDGRCESQRNYGSLLMLCLGTMVPSPKVN